jgi:hypothetical protein
VVTGRGVLDVTVWRQKASMTVHLVNLTNPMMMKGPVREIIPLSAQSLTIRTPPDVKPSAVQLLVSGASPQHRVSGNIIELQVPSVGLHEVVAIDLA